MEKDHVGRPGHIHCRIQKNGAELVWVVSGHKTPADAPIPFKNCFGLPGPFDKDILYAVIWDIEKNYPKPFDDPYIITSWRHILDIAHKSYTSENIALAKAAIKRLSTITVYQSNAFFVKETGKHRSSESIFRPFTRVFIKGEYDEKDDIREESLVFFDPLLLSNINNRYVKPIDFELYMSLQRPLARRIFEILDPKFFAVLRRGRRSVNFRYSTLCQLLPSKQQFHYSLARRVFDRAFDELYKREYLSDVAWKKTDERHDWVINYIPGKILSGYQNNESCGATSCGRDKNISSFSQVTGYREKLIRKINRYFPHCPIPNDISDEKIDHFLYKVEQGEVMPDKVKSPVAYMKSLNIEPFPSQFKREELAERQKTEQKERRETECERYEAYREKHGEEIQNLIRDFNASFTRKACSRKEGGQANV
jgi:hypothetical protein